MVNNIKKKNSLISDFLFFLDKDVKKNLYILLPLILIGAFFELIFLGLIPIIIDFFLENIQNSKIINFLNNYINLNFSSNLKIDINTIIIFLFFFAILKFIYDCFLHIFQSIVIFNIKTSLQKNLLDKYLRNQIIFFKKKNTSILVRNLTTELGLIVSRVLFPSMAIFVNTIIVFIFCIFLLSFNLRVFLTLLILVLVLFFIIKNLTFKMLKFASLEQQYHDGQWIRNIQQIFGAIREIKLIQKMNIFLDISIFHAKNANRTHAKSIYLPLLTKNALELIAIFLFIILVITMRNTESSNLETIKIISIYGFALFRMLPMINKIIIAFQGLKSGKVNLENFIDSVKDKSFDEKNFNNDLPKELNFKNILMKNIKVTYEKKVLDFKEFKISKGDFIGIKGVTGSGKSTFLEILMGLNYPDSGQILIDEKEIQNIRNSWLNNISYVPQDIYLLDDTIEQNIIFYRNDEKNIEKRIELALKNSEIEDFIDTLKLGIKTEIGERGIRISGGQRQRIGIARALFDPKPLLIFDEATSSLDMTTEEKIINNIMNISKEHTIIMVAHRESSLKYCSKVYNLQDYNLFQQQI